MTEFRVDVTETNAKQLLITLVIFELVVSLWFLFGEKLSVSLPEVLWVSGEMTVMTWFSVVQMFVIGLLFIWHRHWPGIHRVVRPGFLFVVAVGFMFLSIDEGSKVHELITQRLKHYDWAPRLFRGNHGIWIPIYLGIFSILVFAGFRTGISMLKAYPRQSILMLVGFTLAAFGALALEAVGYVYLRAERGFLFTIELAVEEFLEMAGMSLVLYGVLLCAIRENQRPVSTMPGEGAHDNAAGTAMDTLESRPVSALRVPLSESGAGKLLLVLILVGIALIAAYLYHKTFDMPRQLHKVFLGIFQLYKEVSIPSWFLSMQFFTVGALFLLHQQWPQAKQLKNHWLLSVAGVGFLVLSVDSMATLSESVFPIFDLDSDDSKRYTDYPLAWLSTCGLGVLTLCTIGRPTLKSMLRAYPEPTRIMLGVFAVYIVCRIFLAIAYKLYLRDAGENLVQHLAYSFSIFINMASGSVLLYAALLCAIREPESRAGH